MGTMKVNILKVKVGEGCRIIYPKENSEIWQNTHKRNWLRTF